MYRRVYVISCIRCRLPVTVGVSLYVWCPVWFSALMDQVPSPVATDSNLLDEGLSEWTNELVEEEFFNFLTTFKQGEIVDNPDWCWLQQQIASMHDSVDNSKPAVIISVLDVLQFSSSLAWDIVLNFARREAYLQAALNRAIHALHASGPLSPERPTFCLLAFSGFQVCKGLGFGADAFDLALSKL